LISVFKLSNVKTALNRLEFSLCTLTPEYQCLPFHQNHMIWQTKTKKFLTEWKWFETTVLLLMMFSIMSALIILLPYLTIALHESGTRTAILWSMTVYNKNLSSQCNFTAQTELALDNINYTSWICLGLLRSMTVYNTNLSSQCIFTAQTELVLDNINYSSWICLGLLRSMTVYNINLSSQCIFTAQTELVLDNINYTSWICLRLPTLPLNFFITSWYSGLPDFNTTTL
jgi:hypothetical protein